MNVEEKLIHRPAAVDLGRRTMFGLMTFLAWSLYLYLWLPLLTFLLWLLGGKTAYLRLFEEPPTLDYRVMLHLLLVASVTGLLLMGWAEYNRIRFRGVERRSAPPPVGIADVAVALRASEAMALALQDARIATVAMDEAAVPIGVTVSQSLQPD